MIGVMTLVMFIIWTAIGRNIINNRHTTAVFRTIGFNLLDNQFSSLVRYRFGAIYSNSNISLISIDTQQIILILI